MKGGAGTAKRLRKTEGFSKLRKQMRLFWVFRGIRLKIAEPRMRQSEGIMRFIHLADVHLAAVPESGTELGRIREKEIYQTFYRILDRCEQEQIDLLLIAGDLFHRPPLVRELKEVNYHFAKLTWTRVVLIAGNHDYIGVHSNYQGFDWVDNVVFLSSEKMESVYFEDLNTRVYGLSYHARDYREALPDGAAPERESEISVLLLHGGEEGKLPFDKKKLGAAGFDYVALGHLHKPQRLSERMAYSGSMEPLDKNETGAHGYYLGEISAHTALLQLEFIPAALRCYQQIEVKVTPDMTNGAISDYCEQKIRETGEENMYRIHLSGRRSSELVLDKEMFFSLGIVTEVQDDTLPDFDFERLEQENRDNILGMFIRCIRSCDASDGSQSTSSDSENEIREKALNYGLEALLRAASEKH